MVPVILEGRNGIRIKANTFLNGGSGSSYLKEEIADVLGLEAERRSLPVSVFGAKSIVLNAQSIRDHFVYSIIAALFSFIIVSIVSLFVPFNH